MMLLGILLLYHDSVVSMVKIWLRSDTYAHGIMILPITLYLIWEKRRSLSTTEPRAELFGLILLAVLSLIWLLAAISNISELSQLVMVAIVIVAVISLLGREVSKCMAFPLFFLFFAVPMGEKLIEPLQDFTAIFVVSALKLTGIPVLLEGRYFSIPSGNFEVAKACSGIRYLMVTVSLGTVYAYLMYSSIKRRLIFIAISIVTPVIANGIRAYGIVILAHLSDMQLAVGVDHFIYGWVFFGIILSVMFWGGARWKDKKFSEIISVTRSPRQSINFMLAALLIIASSAIGPLAYAYTINKSGSKHGIAIMLPVDKAGWSVTEKIIIPWQPEYKEARETRLIKYINKEQSAYLYIALYTTENQGAELINSENILYKSTAWVRLGGSMIAVRLPDNSMLDVNELDLRSKETNLIIWSWYDISGYKFTSEYSAKIYQAWLKLTAKETVSSIVAVAATYNENPAQARNSLENFISDVWPVLTYKIEDIDR